MPEERRSDAMNEQFASKPSAQDRRLEPRMPSDKYYSVQFSVKALGYFYQFKIRNMSDSGLCILVNADSAVLDHISVGDILKMQYYLSASQGSTEWFDTEIRHITKMETGPFKNIYQVGLRLIDPA